ncbi:MAG: protocatechuate 3,4-dioxygenase subunit alpha [Kiloniellaceae bacterium]
MSKERTKPGQTPSQTVGPYFAYGLTPEQYGYPFASIATPDLRRPEVAGEPIRIEGRVLDGKGEPVSDAMIEIWQADPQGRYAHPADRRSGADRAGADRAGAGRAGADRGGDAALPNIAFGGFGRCGTGTDPERRFVFDSLKPGAAGDGQAPHINVIVFLRGLLNHLYTRVYFADEAAANARDPVLRAVPAGRRGTLIAARDQDGDVAVYRFDIHMQGDRETVFFDV